MVISVIGSLFITVVSFFAIQVFFVTYSAINGLVSQNVIIRNVDNNNFSKVDIKNTKFFINDKELSYETPKSNDGINTLKLSSLNDSNIAIYTSKVKEPTINIKEIEISKMVLNIKKNPIFIFGFEDVKMQSIQKVKIPVSYKFKNENNIKVVLNK